MNADKGVIPFEINLVRFDNPEIIEEKTVQTPTKQDKHFTDTNIRHLDSGDNVTETERLNQVLNRILPPREWEKDGKYFRQKISNQPATKLEVKKLGEKLDTYLERFKAREVGLCPIKRELYSQCFNEIIRQSTLNCVERGQMLIQIRDEIKTTIDAYQELFESIMANGIRKALLREHKKAELEKRAEQLRLENETLEASLAETNAAIVQLERETAKMHEVEAKRRAEELSALKKSNQMLKAQLESIIAPKKMT